MDGEASARRGLLVVKIDAKDVGKVLRGQSKKLLSLARQAASTSAHRTVRAVKKKSPVDTGGYRAAWKVRGGISGVQYLPTSGSRPLASVENDHPIAGVIEKGARPHGVSAEGRESIRAWVIRKGIATTARGARVTKRNAEANAEAVDAVVDGIVWKLQHEGQKGLHLLEKEIPGALKFFQAEFERLLMAEKDKETR
jgi:hypothetical protein